MTALTRVGFVNEAYANWGRWVARCGRKPCPRAVQLQRLTPHFECDFCGAVTEVLWPSPGMVEGIERLLMMRPVPSTRNWVPGETLHDLMFENGEHGIFDGLPDMGPGHTLFGVSDTGVLIDSLPALKHRIRKSIEP